MRVVLVGPPGVGKSAVGRALAQRLNRRFIDTDAAIAAEAGMDIASLWRAEGEPSFRQREVRLLQTLADDVVVATGGGTLTAPGALEQLAALGARVIALSAPPSLLLGRVKRRPGQRPLLADDPEAALRALLEERAPLYNRAELRMRAMHRPTRMAAEIQRYLDMSPAPGEVVGSGATTFLRGLLPGPPLLVTDAHLDRIHGHRLRQALGRGHGGTVRMPRGERAKRMEAVVRAARAAVSRGADRDTVIVAAGGGALGDAAGLVAALYMRGVRWAVVPTTLLAMVDASLGGKVAVDLPEGKNLVGAFHPPIVSVVDTDYLATLPEEGWLEGLAESVKGAILGDGGLLADLGAAGAPREGPELEAMVRRAREVKRLRVAADPRESPGGVREHLNLGHTLAHALETLSGHRMSHGEAVAVGLCAIIRLAEADGLLSAAKARPMWAAIERQGLLTRAPEWLTASVGDAVAVMGRDKKARGGRVRLIVPRAVEQIEVVSADEAMLGRLAAFGGLGRDARA